MKERPILFRALECGEIDYFADGREIRGTK